MMQFTDWDILRNLLLAARWTLLLSLIAFIGGALFGLLLTFMRASRRKPLVLLVRGGAVSGHTTADAVVSSLLWSFTGGDRCERLDSGNAGAGAVQ